MKMSKKTRFIAISLQAVLCPGGQRRSSHCAAIAVFTAAAYDRNHGDRIQRWIHRLLVWTGIFFWVNRTLESIGMLDPVLSLGSVILGLTLKRGSISISIEDVLAFGLTLLAAFLLSAFIRFALRAWTNQFSNWAAIRSELATTVYDAVHAAGMAFPFPQREVRILGDQTAQ